MTFEVQTCSREIIFKLLEPYEMFVSFKLLQPTYNFSKCAHVLSGSITLKRETSPGE